MKTTLKATAIAAVVAVGTPVQAEDSQIDKECEQLSEIAMNAAYGRVNFDWSYTKAMGRSESQAERYGWSGEAIGGLNQAIERVYKANPQKLRTNPEMLSFFILKTCREKGGVAPYMKFLQELD